MSSLSFLLCFSLLIGTLVAIDFDSSSSESCEESHEHKHGGGHEGGNNGGGNNRGCDAGWTRFNRPSGGWCVRVFPGTYHQPLAESRCQSQGAVLTGVQNQEEAKKIASLLLPQISQQSGSIYIGLHRTPACSKSPISSSCNSMNSFHWTDGSTTGTDGLLWNNNQPDNAHAATQQCAVLLAAHTPTVVDKWTWQANRLDDVQCQVPAGSNVARTVRGYACGKKARS
ncbi:C-type lectin domain-containing protein [Caenorhabditis elegans]|uniref:C-type lectin domain-containing protein n=1 Tax=Caenorhabditis elegans TaxID=6239 RepID=Q9XUH9_CAEEL|nr:C-type lectin domain-containing protein [Caenorhabditis elegans]CAB05021.1 C-type lectin domain-containing protein [Caenorhabditis elegans]|eukprot:NP_492872.1 C-type LECtin [Caenorhabditis elegans]